MHEDDRSPDIEFLDDAHTGDSATEELAVSPPRHRAVTTLLVGFVLVALALVVTSGLRHHTQKHDRVAAPSAARSSGPPVPTPSVDVPLIDTPQAAIRVALAAVCRSVPTCAIRPGSATADRRARQALGVVRDLETRTVGPGVAQVAAVLAPDGAQLLAIATRADVSVDPTKLGIRPPIGVQTQRNGTARLVVIVSGSVGAVSLLSKPSIQRWLATLRPG